MRIFARPVYGRVEWSRCISAVLLVAYALTAVGMPLPLSNRLAKSGELFPCAASKCGCDSAERCWRSCCCHTLAERLAWARRHGVRPPEYALAKARTAGLHIGWLADSSHVDQEPGKCCNATAGTGKPNSCRMTLTSASPRTNDPAFCKDQKDDPTAPAGSTSLVAWRALKCRGQSMNWLVVTPTLIAFRMQGIERPPMIARLGAAMSERAVDIAQDPAIPPPEAA
jgi:hypothetical protein